MIPSNDDSRRPPLTDSPWFWLAVFSAMGLVALFAIHNKYGRRQAGLEQKYQARARIDEGRSASDSAETIAGEQSSTPLRPMSTPGETLIPLWPVAVVLTIVLLIALAFLARSRFA